MKNFLGLFFLIILIATYVIFFHKESQLVAGEYMHYTIYEKFKSKDKYIDNDANSYKIDKFNFIVIKENIFKNIILIDTLRQKINSYNDSLNLDQNSIYDYDRYLKNLDNLKLDITKHKNIITGYQNDLIKLNDFILKFERDLLSIEMYHNDIANTYLILKSVDSTTSDYKFYIDKLKINTSIKGLKLLEATKKQNIESQQNLLAEMNKQKLETDNKTNLSNYNYNTNYYRVPKLDISMQTYIEPANISYTPNSFYSTNTNPDHIEVDGYTKSNGTYVEPYIRTAPNTTIRDNFSTNPNSNPYTGKVGTIKQ